jgi:hypothetical protein
VESLTRGLAPPDPRSFCYLPSTEFVDPHPKKKILGTPLVTDTTGCGICQDYNISYIISYTFCMPSRMHNAHWKIMHCQPNKIPEMCKLNEED